MLVCLENKGGHRRSWVRERKTWEAERAAPGSTQAGGAPIVELQFENTNGGVAGYY